MMIRSAAVLGAGVMGAQMAAHLANAGVPVTLLDVTRDAAREGLKRARTLKPDPFFTPDLASLIRTGSFDEDLDLVRPADWIIEAIVERLDAKQALLARVDARAPRRTRSSAPTRRAFRSRAIAEGRSDELPPALARHALLQSAALPAPAGDHPDGGHRSRRRRAVATFADRRLGKGVVVAKDTPNFIAQPHRAVRRDADAAALERGDVHDRGDRRDHRTGDRPAEERDVPHDGHRRHRRPRRTWLQQPRERLPTTMTRAVRAAALRRAMIARGLIGEKAGRGFYKVRRRRRRHPHARSGDAGVPPEAAGAAAVARGRASRSRSPANAIRTLFNGKDKVGEFLRADAGADARLHRHGRARRSPLDRRRRSRDAVGLRLGPRPVRDVDAIGASDVLGDRSLANGADVPAPRRPVRNGRPPDLQISAQGRRGSSAATPAPAWSTSATACSASSSTRR